MILSSRPAGVLALALLALLPGQPLAAGNCRSRCRAAASWVAAGVVGATVGRQLGIAAGTHIRALRQPPQAPAPAEPLFPGLPGDGPEVSLDLLAAVNATLGVYQSGPCPVPGTRRTPAPGLPDRSSFRHGGEEALAARMEEAQADPLAHAKQINRARALMAIVDLGICRELERFEQGGGPAGRNRTRALKQHLQEAMEYGTDLKVEMEYTLQLQRDYDKRFEATGPKDHDPRLRDACEAIRKTFQGMVQCHKRLTGAAARLLDLLVLEEAAGSR